MIFLGVLGGFFFGLVTGTPFIGAVAFGVAGGALVYLWKRMDEGSSRQTPARPERENQEDAMGKEHHSDGVPDLSDPLLLRDHLRQLTWRVRKLEDELAALRSGVAPSPQRVPEEGAGTFDGLPEAAPAASEPAATPEPVDLPDMAAWQKLADAPEAAHGPMHELPSEPQPSTENISMALSALAPSRQDHLATESVAIARDGDTEAAITPIEASEPQRPPEPQAPDDASDVRESTEPSFLSRLLSGNIVAKIGAIIVFFGVGFLLKFAYDRGMFPPQVRLIAVALASVAVFILGWKLKDSRRLYGLILQGVASGLAYLTVFFALKTYAYIGVPLGFALFALLGVATTLLAVRQEAKPLAVLGLTGAFMAPILASSGSGNYVFLFTYYLLLNVFILGVSWFRAWRELNLTGWFFTFGIAALWGSRSYTPDKFATIEPFLLIFFAMYLVIPILFATRQPPRLKGPVDGTLVFGTPAAVAVMQSRLVWDLPYGLAWSSAMGAGLYAVLALMVMRRENMRLLGSTYIALSVGLGTLAIAFAFGAYTTFALWTIEGTAILWVCLRQKSLFGRLSAILVQGAGAVQFFLDYGEYSRANPWFNDAVLGCAIIAVASAISAVLYRRHEADVAEGEKQFAGLFLIWGALCYSLGGVDAIHHGVARQAWQPAIGILFFSGSLFVAELLGARTRWSFLRGLTVMHPPILLGAALLQFSYSDQPLADLGWLAWPIGLGSLFRALHRQRRDEFDAGFDARYAGAWLILAGVATWQSLWYLDHREYLLAMDFALVGYLVAAIRFRLREMGGETFRLSTLPLLWASFFWFAGGLLWIHHGVSPEYGPAAVMLFASGSALAAELSGAALGFAGLRSTSLLLPLLLSGSAGLQAMSASHPMANWGWLTWLIGLSTLFFLLHRQRRDKVGAALEFQTILGWILLGGIATWEAVWRLDQHEYLICMGIALAGYIGAGLRFRLREYGTEAVRFSSIGLLWSMFFWFAAGFLWLEDSLIPESFVRAGLVFVALSSLTYELVFGALNWGAMRWGARLPWISIPVALVTDFMLGDASHPFAGWAGLAWPLSWLLALYGLNREEKDGERIATGPRYAIALYVPIALVSWELVWWLMEWQYGYPWRLSALALPAIAVVTAISMASRANRWPLAEHWPLFRDVLHSPLIVAMAIWTLIANLGTPGSLQPFSVYLPLLNPIDFTIATAAFAVWVWARRLDAEMVRSAVWKILAVLGFVWINAMALRCIHYWVGVPYRVADLMNSVLVQATLSILWTSAALALMVLSRRRLQRLLWIIGAALLALVVGKLFLIDLANTGTVARIVSFLGVGVLLLVIGFVAPVPPGVKESEGRG
jgi:uncharacterized membrane protein